MADTKISALSAVSAVADANEFAINEAGTSKKGTAAQIKTYVNTAPSFAAGSATAATWPVLGTGTVLTTPESGALERQSGILYVTPVASGRHVWDCEQFIASTSTRTLTSNTNSQAIFTTPTNGTLTLGANTTYFYEACINISSMSGTSGNCGFDIKGAGTATVSSAAVYTVGMDTGTPSTAASQGGSFIASTGQTGNIVTAATGTAVAFFSRGILRITTAGTIIPSVQLTTAASAVIGVNSWVRIWPVGSDTVVTVGNWS